MIARTRVESSLRAVGESLLEGGPAPVDRFERALARYFGVADALAVSTGRAALALVLEALPERRVYLPPYMCSVVPEACMRAGKELSFVDIDLDTLNVDVDRLAEVLEPRSIILAVHAFGMPCNLARIGQLARERECVVVEDNAAAFGSRYRGRLTGTFGSAAVLSFDWSKTLVTGRGGALLFTDEELAKRARAVRDRRQHRPNQIDALFDVVTHLAAMQPFVYGRLALPLWSWLYGPYRDTGAMSLGRDRRYGLGFGWFQARLGCRALAGIHSVLARRRALARCYARQLSDLDGLALPRIPEDCDPVFTLFPVRATAGAKMAVYRACRARGVDLGFSYSYSCAPGYPNAARAAAEVLNLPLYSSLSDDEAARVIEAVRLVSSGTAVGRSPVA